MAKYFATSLATENVVKRAARDQQLLADFDHLDQLGRIRIEVDHVAGFFGGLRSGVHRQAHVGLRQRGSVVGAVAGHGDELAFGLFGADQRQLVFGLGLREKIVKAGFARDGRGGERIIARDHHGADAHGSQLIEAFAHAALDDVLQMNRAENAAIFGHQQRRAAGVGDGLHGLFHFRRHAIADCARSAARWRRTRPCGFGGRRDRRPTCASRRVNGMKVAA